jgi:hypothetical protein
MSAMTSPARSGSIAKEAKALVVAWVRSRQVTRPTS